MGNSTTRRNFLKCSAVGAASGLGDLAFLSRLPSVSAEEAKQSTQKVQLRPEIEPLVRLLEETPRDKVLEEFGARVRRGASYRDVLTALMLAGVRNIQPRPAVGFKFHAVLVVNSAHLASLASPATDRWLPIFWALDEFKDSQARDEREGAWTMGPVDPSATPTASKARSAFLDAMDRWDESASDAAVAALTRSAGAHDLFELMAIYGMRDFRSIGHKAIYVANSWRTLQCIGWRHAEPVMRSLAYALLNHVGEPNPSKSDLPPDRPIRANVKRAARIRDDWQAGRIDDDATKDLLAVLRSGTEEESSEWVVEALNRGVAPQSIWDGLLVGAGELLMRQPGIVGLHAVTSTNALHYIYQTSAEPETRKLALLQNAAFLPLFHKAMQNRGAVGKQQVDQLETVSLPEKQDDKIAEIFTDVGGDQQAAARKVLSYLREGNSPETLIDAARRLVFLKGDDSHDYKFSSAVLEDYYHVSPQWRDQFLATSVFKLRSSLESDNALVKRIRETLAT